MSDHSATTANDDSQNQRRNGSKNADKHGLSANRRRDVIENDEYAAFARRIVRAYARRAAAGDIEAVASMANLAAELDAAIHDAVIGLHEFGYSWTEIGGQLGISRQAARQRWCGPTHR
jgi:hypothetical protein